MRYSDKDYIAVGFDDDRIHITPVILMNGRGGLKKILQGISGKENMVIYHVNFTDKTCIDVGRVRLPQDISAVDMIIHFNPEEDGGIVTICDNDMPSVEVVKNSVHCIAAMYKRYAQGFTDIIFGGASAIDAFRKCEKMTEDELRLALETALGDDLSDSSLRELLSHLEENLDVSADKENKTGEIEEKSEEPHIKMNLFGIGGEA